MSADLDEGNVDGLEEGDNDLINSLIQDGGNFNDLVFERDVEEIDQIEAFCNYYTKHLEKAKFKELRKFCEFQMFELICVCAWEHVSTTGKSFKNDLKWNALVGFFDNILDNFPVKEWWRTTIMQFLQSTTLPKGLIELINEYRNTVTISKSWKDRHKGKLNGCNEHEIRVLHFGYKIEDTAKKAVSEIGMHYNKLYRSPEELPSGTNNTSRLYLAIKNCLFPVEKKFLYLQKRRRQFYRERESKSKEKVSKAYLMEGFEEFIAEEKANLIVEDYFPKHWLTFQMCSFPINERFPGGVYVRKHILFLQLLLLLN
jgi:hypothetical protein